MMLTENGIPEKFICSITKCVFFSPVVTADGQTYENEAIARWLKNNQTSPNTGKKLDNTSLSPCFYIQDDIVDWLSKSIPKDQSLIEQVYFPQETVVAAIEENDINAVKQLIHHDKVLIKSSSRFLTNRLQNKESNFPYSGYTTFQFVCSNGSPEMVRFFLELLKDQATETQQSVILLQKPKNWVPVHLNKVLIDSIKLGEEKDFIELCLKLGANVNVLDEKEHGSTLLHFAAKYGHASAAQLLLDMGANLEATATDNSTPLNFSAYYGNLQVMSLLLAANANIHHQDSNGNTPLHDAVQRGHEFSAKLLLKYGASKHIKNNKGILPLETVDEKNRLTAHKMASLLQEFSFSVKQKRQKEIQRKLAEQAKLLEEQAKVIAALSNKT
jgi:ankyrin repeat protein